MYIFLLLISVFVSSISQIILKKASMEEYENFIKEYLNVKVISGYSLMVLSTILTILAFKGLDYKNGPIIETIGYIMVMFLSKCFLQETITKKKILGNVLILLGIVIFYIN